MSRLDRRVGFVLALCCVLSMAATAGAEPRYDVVIAGGRIVDGTGAPSYSADIAIRGGRIVVIGRLNADDAATVIDAKGLIVAPGFVDMMGQTATPMLRDSEAALNLLTQGITTINAGEGASAAPLDAADGQAEGWTTFAEYFQLIDMKGLPVNVVQTVGHTQVRRLVLGESDRAPRPEELQRMQQHVEEAMRAGAIGVSTALIYPPAVYADTPEIAALVSVAGKHGGRYYTHMRNEGDLLLEAIDEALEIGRQGNAPVHIFHLKTAGRQNWGKMQLAIARIRAARAAGQDVTADIYPYINNGLGIEAFIHPRHFGEGREKLRNRLSDEELRAEIRKEMETTSGWENWFRHVGHDWNKVIIGQAGDKRYAEHAGQSVAEIAKRCKEDPWVTFFTLCETGAFAQPESMTHRNKILAMQQNFISFCTDVGPDGGSRIASHPRGFGAFPRLLSYYVRDLGAIPLEQAVAQASAAGANAVLAYDRGRIAIGQAADVIVFDYENLKDNATFSNPRGLSTGMKYVLVNGTIVLKEGELTDERPGRVLRGPGYDASVAAPSVSRGETLAGLERIDRIAARFLERHNVPGLSLAITDHGRLVLARGYGYADVATREPVLPTNLFRIASVSKPVTAAAILKLVDEGQLALDDRVFDILSYEPFFEKVEKAESDEGESKEGGNEDEEESEEDVNQKFDERHREITVRHLLQHRGGWDRDGSFDPMFRAASFARLLGVDAPAGPDEVIRVMLGRKLDFAPGERYAYSNLGYCLLGRIIEKKTGRAYEDHLRETILAPLGIEAMRLGRTRLAERQAGEVRYYDPNVGSSVFAGSLGRRTPQPYGAWNLEAMDSHGGWLASAVDLVRFASILDGGQSSPLLSESTLEAIRARPDGKAGHDDEGKPKAAYYGLGFRIVADDAGRVSLQHGGSLPGTNTLLVHRDDGRSVAILFNSRTSARTERVATAFYEELSRSLESIETWPQGDLFPKYPSTAPDKAAAASPAAGGH